MNRSVVALVAAVVGLLSLVLLVRSRTRSDIAALDDSDTPRAARPTAPAGRDHWAAPSGARNLVRRPRPVDRNADDSDADNFDAAGGTRSASRAGRRGGDAGLAGGGDAGLANVDGGPDASDDEAGGVAGNEAGGAAGKAAGKSGSGGAPHPGGPGGKGKDGSVAPAAAEADAAADPEKEKEPVLSLKFDKSTMPEKGDNAPIVEQGITFDDQGAHFGADAQFAIPNAGNVRGAAGTISFWVNPEWAGDPESTLSLVQLRTNTFENRIQIFKNGPYLRFIFCDNTGTESGVGVEITNWQPNQGHVVTATWGDGVTSLYIDGNAIGHREYNGELEVGPSTPLLVGSDLPNGAGGAQSTIKDFKIFSRALPPEEVFDLAAQSKH